MERLAQNVCIALIGDCNFSSSNGSSSDQLGPLAVNLLGKQNLHLINRLRSSMSGLSGEFNFQLRDSDI